MIPEVSTQDLTRLLSILPLDNVTRNLNHILKSRTAFGKDIANVGHDLFHLGLEISLADNIDSLVKTRFEKVPAL